MKRKQIINTLLYVAASVLMSVGVMSCSDKQADEPAYTADDTVQNDVSGRNDDSREVVDGIFSFQKDTVIICESGKEYCVNPYYETRFIPFEKIGINPEFNINKDDIKVCAAYSYDISRFGTDLDPWIDLNIEPSDLPATIDWLSAQIEEVDGAIGLTVREAPDAAPWSNPRDGERAIKLDILIGLNDTQCTVCSTMVIQHRLIDNEAQPENCEGFLFSFTPASTARIPAEGGEGVITMSYIPEGYEYYKNNGWAIPAHIQFYDLTISEKIGDPIKEAEERGIDIYIPNDGWTDFNTDRVMNADGVCDLGWAKIRISDNPDGSKRFEYTVSKNTTGKQRQIGIVDSPAFRGPEYKLGRFYGLNIHWSIGLIQSES